MTRAHGLRRWREARRRRRSLTVDRLTAERVTARELVVADIEGNELIVLEVIDGAAILRIGAASDDTSATAAVAISAYPPLDDDPPIAGISLVVDGTATDTWEVRGPPGTNV